MFQGSFEFPLSEFKRPHSFGCWSEGAGSIRSVPSNEILFEEGDPRVCLYRVEAGAVALYRRGNGDKAVIDFAFPGDLVGLGSLDTHICSARVFGETKLTCLPLESQSREVAANAKAQLKLQDALEREFEIRRAAHIEAGRQSPLVRVAAFLVSLSRTNRLEGRDPCVVDGSASFVADLLGLSVDALGAVLSELQHRGLVEPIPGGGLRIKNTVALEMVVDLPSQVIDRPTSIATGPRFTTHH